MSITTKDLLQELLNETQGEISTYRQLPKKKRMESPLFEAYKYLIRREIMLKEKIKEEEGGDKFEHRNYDGSSPSCDTVR